MFSRDGCVFWGRVLHRGCAFRGGGGVLPSGGWFPGAASRGLLPGGVPGPGEYLPRYSPPLDRQTRV